MFYRLQDVMFSKFNIVQDIYELTRLIQLKENHYKRINDVKSRRRWSAVVTIEIETKSAIIRLMNIITISISINEKVEQISTKTTIWDFNQFRISTSRVTSRTFNFDSIKKKFMKADKCFNYDESNHLNRDCSKFRKFRIVEMNVKNDTKKSKKKIIFVKDVTKTKDLIISSFLMKNDLFDETFVLINCVLRNKIFTITMIDINVIKYAFVDELIAQSLCEILKIELVQLIKKRLIRIYDERKNQIIIHVIYSKMTIQEHIESLIFMLIIKLKQQILILEKSWMRKHEINYHEKTNIIEFFSEFFIHSKRIKTKTTSSSNKKKNFFFEKKSFLNQSNHS